MKTVEFSLTELGLLAVTRIALGAGVGLLLSRCLSDEQRKAAGVALTAIGVVTTFPLALKVVQQLCCSERM